MTTVVPGPTIPAAAVPQPLGGIAVRAPVSPAAAALLSPACLAFVAELHRWVEPARRRLLQARRDRQAAYDAGAVPAFLPETAELRAAAWTVDPVPRALADRRVEITGPTDRKMMINALNSGARVFMADLEDATSPTWANVTEGQVNLADAVQGTLSWTAPDGRRYAVGERPAVLAVRPRGWHLDERHVTVDEVPLAGALFDAGVFLFHSARTLAERGLGPLLYLPKLECDREAALWADVLGVAEASLGLARGTIKATVLVETLPAAFRMHEILWALRAHSAGLNCGRWDYIFSVIKVFRAREGLVFPDRRTITMDRGFLRAYAQLTVQSCHRRGAHAIGGMAAQLPIRGDAEANARAVAAVEADKRREAGDGHDGTWVAHPDLVAPVRAIFDAAMPGPHQLHVTREDVRVGADALLALPTGPCTEAGLRANLEVAVRYLGAWLGGRGAVPIGGLMEDAATAEISRSQAWQWLHHRALLDDGSPLTPARYAAVRDDVVTGLRRDVGETAWTAGRHGAAAELVDTLVRDPQLADFATLAALERLG